MADTQAAPGPALTSETAGPRPRIAFIGAGATGVTLAEAFARAGLRVTAVYRRDRAKLLEAVTRVGTALAAETPQATADAADVVFLTVPDDQVGPTCAAVRWRAGQAVVHCSGATELDALGPAARSGAAVGAFHPMQMFTPAPASLETLPGCTVTIDARDPLGGTLESLARAIGCRPLRLASGRRALYHASIYNVGPFLIALIREAAAMWAELGATEEETLAALLPLLQGTVAAVRARGLAGGMGGCVARGDVGTVERHLAALDQFSADAAALYRTLALRTIPLALERGTLTAEGASLIRATLQRPPRDSGGSANPPAAFVG